ncbi:MAG: cyclic nucleotide-binding domain-containing protein [Candidatus Eremiobacteraeota bacterium]|nr:cyclic nucleotide-binding domain-containing protein [Candidatus Eremiobacteraeota bacterium]
MLTTLEKILFLKQIDIFHEFTARELGILAQKATEVGFSKNQVIFNQGDPGDALYLLLGGKVRVVREEGLKRETLAVLEERSCFGEMAILGVEYRTATVEAADVVTLLKISKEDFHELIMEKPDMAFPIFKILTKRISSATDLYVGRITPEERHE